MIALSLRGPMRASLSVLDSGGSGAMPVRRLLAFVGVGLIVIGTLAAAVAVTGQSPRVAVSRIGTGTSSRINNRVPGKVELDSSWPYAADPAALSSMTRTPGSVLAWNELGPAGTAYDSGIGAVGVLLSSESAFRQPLVAGLTITDLGTLGGSFSVASGINGLGQVVGQSSASSGFQHAFLWQNGTMADLGTLGGTFSEARSINDAGGIVGASNTTSGIFPIDAFLWQNGTTTDLGNLGGNYESAATAINDPGQVVGVSLTASFAAHAFLWQNGTMADLGTLGGTFSLANDINDRGQVVGESNTSSGSYRAFLWQNGTMTDLGTLPGGTVSSASGINDLGQIVGVSLNESTTPFVFHVLRSQTGTMTDRGAFRATTGINDLGQIVGVSFTTSGAVGHAVLWQNGTMTDLGTLPNGTISLALSINELGTTP